jgi:DNA-binding response OmpR family regulator
MVDVPAILLIEQALDDALAFEKAVLETREAHIHIHICRNFSEAKAYLRGAGQYQNRNQFPFPQAVVVSLMIAGAYQALQFLAWLNESVEKTPIVFVLTRSPLPAHHLQAIELGARLFDKPESAEALRVIVRQIVLATQTAAVAKPNSDALRLR